MAAFLAAVCGTLIVLAFCQVIIEMILPEGTTKRYVTFVAGLVALAVIVSLLAMTGPDIFEDGLFEDCRDAAHRREGKRGPRGRGGRR